MKRLYILCILLICVLFSSALGFGLQSFSTEHCHSAAKEYVLQKGYDIDTAMFDGFSSVILTKDSTVLWINSNKLKYPYVKEFIVVRDYK